ncbi:MAG: hypothetical protein NXI16_09250 [Alphaproteobacteria bacterium]|nr:hypothetical protein [Alphaproteobacteria bacterium]
MAVAVLAAENITNPVTAQIVAVQSGFGSPGGATVQFALTTSGGGTSVTAWVQTSIDGQKTWSDIACFAVSGGGTRFVTVDGRKSIPAPTVLSEGGLAENTVQEGILGSAFRVKYTTVGTWNPGTLMTVEIKTHGD